MKFALETAMFGLGYAASLLRKKNTPKTLRLAKLLEAAEAGISEYMSNPDGRL